MYRLVSKRQGALTEDEREALKKPARGYRRSFFAGFNPRSETHVREGAGSAVRRAARPAAGSVAGSLIGGGLGTLAGLATKNPRVKRTLMLRGSIAGGIAGVAAGNTANYKSGDTITRHRKTGARPITKLPLAVNPLGDIAIYGSAKDEKWLYGSSLSKSIDERTLVEISKGIPKGLARLKTKPGSRLWNRQQANLNGRMARRLPKAARGSVVQSGLNNKFTAVRPAGGVRSGLVDREMYVQGGLTRARMKGFI